MSIDGFELTAPPADPRARELWLQAGAGFILVEGARRHAREQIDATLDAQAQSAARQAVDDALYAS